MEEKAKSNLLCIYKKEIIIIAALLLSAVISLVFINAFAKRGEYAEVRIDGVTAATYRLDTDGVYTLLDGKNVLIIENGYAYMSEADCPDGTCIRTGKISKAGESIVCLPNKISVIIRGGDGADIIL